ncbi:putative guanine deaminase [Neonectria ditissima]|uniref:Probable guanine deaminase n=1 Tax=Neonectria ditissima TaxID=78410 RepID=A0A0P7B4D8_9HYPO|nr:putative guanine deaminase [Neonectria ditissima]
MSTAEALPFAFHGTLIHSPNIQTITMLENALLTIDASTGHILTLHPNISPDQASQTLATLAIPPSRTTRLTRGQFLIPGFVDTHNHAPQWTQRGLGQGMHILDWLAGVTFPNEARFRDPQHARAVYAALVAGMLRQGVTAASYYASLHGEATRVLADTCLQMGQRAFVGKCNMNRGSPDYYREASAGESLAETERCVSHVRAIDPSGSLVKYVITPRFAISCDADLLVGLGDMAARNPDLPIQTHFNEAEQEVQATLSLFPAFANEVNLYSHYGLLQPRTILAHCTIMTDAETQSLAALGCGVAHCPTANMTVGGGFMAAPVRDFLSRGIKVGLGTDSGGGFSTSILDSMRHALVASFSREAASAGREKGLTLDEVFYLATMGGARVMGMDDKIGSFSVGKEFDAVVVDMNAATGGVNAPVEEEDEIRTIFDKFLMTGDDRNMTQVFVRGRKVHAL